MVQSSEHESWGTGPSKILKLLHYPQHRSDLSDLSSVHPSEGNCNCAEVSMPSIPLNPKP